MVGCNGHSKHYQLYTVHNFIQNIISLQFKLNIVWESSFMLIFILLLCYLLVEKLERGNRRGNKLLRSVVDSRSFVKHHGHA